MFNLIDRPRYLEQMSPKYISVINAKKDITIPDIYGKTYTEAQSPLRYICEKGLQVNLIRGFNPTSSIAPQAPISIDAFMKDLNTSAYYADLVPLFTKNGAFLDSTETTEVIRNYLLINTIFNPIKYKQMIGSLPYYKITATEQKYYVNDLTSSYWKPLSTMMEPFIKSMSKKEVEDLVKTIEPLVAGIRKNMLQAWVEKAENAIKTQNIDFIMNEALANLHQFKQELLAEDTAGQNITHLSGEATSITYNPGWSPAYKILAEELAQAETALARKTLSLDVLAAWLEDTMNKLMTMHEKYSGFRVKPEHAENIRKDYFQDFDISQTALFNKLQKRIDIIKQRIAANETGTAFDDKYRKEFNKIYKGFSRQNSNIKPLIVDSLEKM
ncbi:MAG TPA: hypothetical protein VGW78_01780 [Candidatus Babeliales bacterium]|nr:hypothetical protein [Candidatus Babeliales bacterium]